MYLKILNCCFFCSVQTSMTLGFQMSYYSSSQLKGLENCDLSKFEVQKENYRAAHSSVAHCQDPDFFHTSNFDRSQFWSPLMMNSSSFESPKSYFFGNYSKNSIKALLSYVIFAQSNLIYIVLMLQAGVFLFGQLQKLWPFI